MRYRTALPQLEGNLLLTDGGMETTLVFLEGIELPCFASFPLLETEEGRAALTRYFEPYLDVARQHGTGFVVEARDVAGEPGLGQAARLFTRRARGGEPARVDFVAAIAEREEEPGRPFVLNAPFGPEGDAYDPASRMTRGRGRALPLLAGA